MISMPREHTIPGAGGVRLHALAAGAAGGRPLVFLHGIAQSAHFWRAQLDSDLAGRFRLVAFDLRGHGRSGKPRETGAYGDERVWADDLRAVLTALDLDGAVLVGWSYGGLVVGDYLAVHGQSGLAGVALVGAPLQAGIRPARPLFGPRFLALLPGLTSTDAEEHVAAQRALVELVSSTPLPPRELALRLGESVRTPPRVLAEVLARKLDREPAFAALRLPALVVHGEADAVIDPLAARRAADLVPGARLSLWPGAGHAPFAEDPARFNAELAAFADGLS